MAEIRNQIFSSYEYSKKFSNTDCYIKFNNTYLKIEKILNQNLICKILIPSEITISTVKIKESLITMNVQINDKFTKLVPTQLNRNLYLSDRPNFVLNE